MRLIKLDPNEINTVLLEQAAEIIRSGGLVAFPTETVYGLGANALDAAAAAKIFTAKGRPADNPLIVHVSSIRQAEMMAREIPDSAYPLMKNFWGGPLTLIFKRKEFIPDIVTAGRDTVAVRLPSHPIAHALIAAAGLPIAAPSANISGRPSPTAAKHAVEDLGGSVDMIIDGGLSQFGIESTVLDMSQTHPCILRPGAVSREQILKYLPDTTIAAHLEGAPASPGMKYTHYAPNAEVIAVRGPDVPRLIRSLLDENPGKRIGVISLCKERYPVFWQCAPGLTTGDYAARLYYMFREFDHLGGDLLIVEEPPAQGIGEAVINRIRKAAGK